MKNQAERPLMHVKSEDPQGMWIERSWYDPAKYEPFDAAAAETAPRFDDAPAASESPADPPQDPPVEPPKTEAPKGEPPKGGKKG